MLLPCLLQANRPDLQPIRSIRTFLDLHSEPL